MRKWNKKHLIALCTAVVLFIGAAAFAADRPTISTEDIDAIINTTTDPNQVTSPFIAVSNAVRSSVVGIKNYQMQRQRQPGGSVRNGLRRGRQRLRSYPDQLSRD